MVRKWPIVLVRPTTAGGDGRIRLSDHKPLLTGVFPGSPRGGSWPGGWWLTRRTSTRHGPFRAFTTVCLFGCVMAHGAV